jgi:hypothetical protein
MHWTTASFCAWALASLVSTSAWAVDAGSSSDTSGCKPACTSNAQCPGGQTCILAASGPCHNGCVAIQNPCASNADCGGCGQCVGSACQQPYVVPCEKDGDCGGDAICVVNGGDACKNVCQVKAATKCEFNADCPDCGLCISGTCKAPTTPACTAKGGCGAGEVCKLDENDDPCYNTCVPGELDAGSGDVGAAKDVYYPADASQADSSAHANPDAAALADAQDGAGEAAVPDSTVGDAQAADSTGGSSGTTPAATPARASGCTATPRSAGSTGPWAALLLAASALAWRRRA